MRALTVQPGLPNSIQLEDVPPPPASDGDIVVRAMALGICGTDREIIAGDYGWAPPGAKRLIIGHEFARPRRGSAGRQRLRARRSGRRRRAPARSGAVSGLRRRRMGHVPQRPIHRARHQAAQRLRLRAVPARARFRHSRSIRRSDMLGVLLEPTSVVAKAWEHIERIGHRGAAWHPRVALITGAGPIGLLGCAARARSAALKCMCSTARTRGRSPRWCAISAPPTTSAISASSRPDIVWNALAPPPL